MIFQAFSQEINNSSLYISPTQYQPRFIYTTHRKDCPTTTALLKFEISKTYEYKFQIRQLITVHHQQHTTMHC